MSAGRDFFTDHADGRKSPSIKELLDTNGSQDEARSEARATVQEVLEEMRRAKETDRNA